VERRAFIAALASTPAASLAGADATGEGQPAAPAAAPRPLKVTLLGTGTPSPSLDRQRAPIDRRDARLLHPPSRRPHALLSLLCLPAVLSTAGIAQSPPDFSGTWTLEAPAIATTPAVPGTPAAAAAPGDMGSGWGPTITIAQDPARLSVEYTVFSRYDLQPPLTFQYPLDGSEGRNAVMMGRGEQIERSRARWDGRTLVITTTFHVAERGVAQPFTAEVTRRLSLESPATLVVDVTRAGVLGGPATTTRAVYRKG
jgi:hypothetical protein